ncbi:MAG: enoyl-CoA hydratase/isomerase family protein [Deltaproteobacteria bacterium]|nr:enoyl-CoA hydratase/isomerase family protein [Deltaproteobacteria bacterium]
MKAYRTILYQKQAPVGILTMNRPEKLNAMNLEMKNELYEALSQMEADGDPHGRGPGLFLGPRQ